ncbi:MAG: FHA domain-containing protein [Deltaproteobacteria bacterium]|nr:FHA domain-containing protein [Deltaproteobacteria bacterium]
MGKGQMSLLTLYRDEERVGEHVLMRAVVSLGRHPDNDIVLDDLSLSRFHARIERRGDRYVVVDLGSQNGVFINGVRITGESVVRPGDRIGLGRFIGIFNEGAKTAPARGSSAPAAARAKAPAPGKVPALQLVHDGIVVERFPLKPEGMIIGRSQKCDIVIGLLALSRRHARVRRGDDSRWYAEDLGSQNGTYVNDVPLSAPTALGDGDVLNFFEYALVFEAGSSGDAEEELPPAAAPAPGVDSTRALRKRDTRRIREQGSLDEQRLVSEVIELSAEDVEELSPDFEQSVETRHDRSAGIDIRGEEPTDYREARVVRSWPSASETSLALAASQRPATSGRLEVMVDGRVVTEVPLALGAVRIGSDARCDVALPPLPGIAPWHVLVVAVGEAVIMLRIGDAPAPRIDGRVVYQSFLMPGDKVELGRAAIVYRA